MGSDIRTRFIDAAERLLRAGRKAESLTSREIAVEAGSSVGLVNYHFGSKDALVALAVERMFAEFAPRWDRVLAAKEAAGKDGFRAGKEELKALLKDIAEVSERASLDFSVKRELMEGDLGTTKFLAPILRAILPEGTDERRLRWASFFIVAPLQLLLLRREWFADWTGSAIADKKERDAVFDFLVDRILEPFAAEAGAGSGNIS